MLRLRMMNKNPLMDFREMNFTTIGKSPKVLDLSFEEEVEYWKNAFIQEHSTLRAVTFMIRDTEMRGDIAAQLLRATKGHPQPAVQSSRPDWNNGEKRRPSNETFVNFAHIHTAESWMALCRQRLCFATMKETKEKVENIIGIMRVSSEPFFIALADCSVPQCIYRVGCCDRKNCGFFESFRYNSCVTYNILDRYKEYLRFLQRGK